MNIIEALHYMLTNENSETIDDKGVICRFNGEGFQQKNKDKWEYCVHLVNSGCLKDRFEKNNFFNDFQEALDEGVACFMGEDVTFDGTIWTYYDSGKSVFDTNYIAELLDLKNWTKK